MNQASNLCSPTCKAAIQAFLSALTKKETALYTQAGIPQARHHRRLTPPPNTHTHT